MYKRLDLLVRAELELHDESNEPYGNLLSLVDQPLHLRGDESRLTSSDTLKEVHEEFMLQLLLMLKKHGGSPMVPQAIYCKLQDNLVVIINEHQETEHINLALILCDELIEMALHCGIKTTTTLSHATVTTS